MKPILRNLFILMAMLPFLTFAQNGTVKESLTFESKIVNYPVKFSIYLPPGYETTQRSYPVLYLLHGYTDNETAWMQFGEADIIADRGISNGDFPPCIIVMPDGKVSWYCNAYDGKDRWEDMFIQEFIPFIEKNYRARPKKEFRAIAGLSMGGYGALKISMRNTDMFSSCVALSSGTFTDDEFMNMGDEQYEKTFGKIFGPGLKGNDRLTNAYKTQSPLHLLESVTKEKLNSVKYYVDCGDDDFLFRGNSALHVKMRELGINHEYRARNGGHVWEYWRTGLFDGLKFISQSFRR